MSQRPDEEAAQRRLENAAAALNVKGLETLPAPRQEKFALYPECIEAVSMFGRLRTQWRMGQAGPTGLDYGSVQWLFSLHPVEDPAELMDDLQIMELAWLEEFYGGK